MLVPALHYKEDFPLEQSHNGTLRSAFDQMMSAYSQIVRPDVALTLLHFVTIRDRIC